MNFLASKLSTIWQMLEKISKTNSKEETFLMILNHCVSELDGGCKFSPSFFRTWKGLHFHMRNMEDLLAPIKCVALGWPTQLDHGHRFLHLSSFGAPSNFCTFVVVTIWCWYTAMWSVGERKRDAIYQIQITTHSKCDTWAASIVLAKHTYPNVTYPWPWAEKGVLKTIGLSHCSLSGRHIKNIQQELRSRHISAFDSHHRTGQKSLIWRQFCR